MHGHRLRAFALIMLLICLNGSGCCRYVRKHVAKTVRLRFVPDIRFFLDDSVEQDEQVQAACTWSADAVLCFPTVHSWFIVHLMIWPSCLRLPFSDSIVSLLNYWLRGLHGALAMLACHQACLASMLGILPCPLCDLRLHTESSS